MGRVAVFSGVSVAELAGKGNIPLLHSLLCVFGT